MNVQASKIAIIALTYSNPCNSFTITENFIKNQQTSLGIEPTALSLTELNPTIKLTTTETINAASLIFIDITNDTNSFKGIIDNTGKSVSITPDKVGDYIVQGLNGDGNVINYYSDILTIYDKDLSITNKQYYYNENAFTILLTFENILTEKRIRELNVDKDLAKVNYKRKK